MTSKVLVVCAISKALLISDIDSIGLPIRQPFTIVKEVYKCISPTIKTATA